MGRNLKGNEADQYTSLLNILSKPNISKGVDERRWNASKDGSFSVSSFFAAINRRDGLWSMELGGKYLEAQYSSKISCLWVVGASEENSNDGQFKVEREDTG